MRHYWQYSWFLVATLLLSAGEYSAFSPGVTVSGGRLSGSHKNLVDTNSGNTKQVRVKSIVGIGLTGQLRLDGLCLGNLNS